MFKRFKTEQPTITAMRFFVPMEEVIAPDGALALQAGREVVVEVSERRNRPPRLWVRADQVSDPTFRVLG